MSDNDKNLIDKDINRRTFLKWAIFGMGGLITAILGGAGTGYFLSPLLRKEKEEWIDIGRTSDFAKGVPAKVDYVERKKDAWITTEKKSSVWVLTSNGADFIVYDPRCTHLGCPFRWDDDKKMFLCPCHNGVFSVDGTVVSGPPPRPLDRYPTKIVGGRLLVLPVVQSKEKTA